MLDDDFKVGGVQVSTSLYVKDAATSICSYSCPLFCKKRERDNRHATKNLNNIKEKRSNSFCVCECDRELSFLF